MVEKAKEAIRDSSGLDGTWTTSGVAFDASYPATTRTIATSHTSPFREYEGVDARRHIDAPMVVLVVGNHAVEVSERVQGVTLDGNLVRVYLKDRPVAFSTFFDEIDDKCVMVESDPFDYDPEEGEWP